MSASDPKFGMTKAKAIAILESIKKYPGADKTYGPSDSQKAALDIAIQLIERCETCRGSGIEELTYMPNPPFTKKFTSTGVARYFVTCRRCKGTKKNLVVTCTSCGLPEQIVWDSKSLDHCQKCIERLKRKGVI